jgi:ribosomal protein S12 methylthiotransferase
LSAPVSKVYFVSLGCPKNRVDSELMLGQLASRGYQVVGAPEEADTLVVNTCSFVEDARRESIDSILDLAQVKTEAGGSKRLVVAGCLAERHADELRAELPEVDLFLGTGDVGRFGELVAEAPTPAPARPRERFTRPGYNYDAYSPRLVTTPPWTTYVKIAEGCSQRCSFCIIPRLRGGQKSRPAEDILQEVRDLAGRGVKEVNLIAQDLTHYGDDLQHGKGDHLSALLESLVEVDGLRWIRLLYCYPHNFTDRLIDLIAGQPKIATYVDMPLQHISDRMLEIMRRRFSEVETRALVRRMRERIPGLTFRTTLIVGHPGETEDDFKRLLDFVGESRFERLGVFKYSTEEGTHAARRNDPVMTLVKEDRYHRVMSLQREISAELCDAMVGREVELLVEGASDETDLLLEGRIAGQAPEIDGVTYVNEGFAPPGSFVRAEIVEAGDYDLVARIL